jgi:hypothetical protein
MKSLRAEGPADALFDRPWETWLADELGAAGVPPRPFGAEGGDWVVFARVRSDVGRELLGKRVTFVFRPSDEGPRVVHLSHGSD